MLGGSDMLASSQGFDGADMRVVEKILNREEYIRYHILLRPGRLEFDCP